MALFRKLFNIPEHVEEEPHPERDRELEATKARIALLQREADLMVRDKNE